MTQAPDKEDEQWLDALAGRRGESADSKVIQQAESLRRALKVRAELLETKVPYADKEQYEKILFRLQRERLRTSSAGWRESAGWLKVAKVLGVSGDVAIQRNPVLWGMAAVLLLVVITTIRIQTPEKDESIRYRGDPNVVRQIVDNPEQRANEIIANVKTISPGIEINRMSYGRIQLKIKDSQLVRDYLATQRIEPIFIDGTITIDVVPKEKK